MQPLPRVTYDRNADAVYVTLRRGRVARTASLDSSRTVDYDTHGAVLGVEILGVSEGLDLNGIPEGELVDELLTKHLRGIAVLTSAVGDV